MSTFASLRIASLAAVLLAVSSHYANALAVPVSHDADAASAAPRTVEQLENHVTPLQTSGSSSGLVQHRSLGDRYWKKGQCRYKGIQPQWRKKASNSWHDCPANTVCDDGRRGCQCATGFTATANADSAYPTCSTCPANSVSAVGDDTCTQCTAGYAPDAMRSACKPCHAGTFSAAGSTSCMACPAGTASDEGAAACTAYAVTEFEFQSESKCHSNREETAGMDGHVATVTAGLQNGKATGAEECEEACSQALATGTDNEAGCCFLNTFNGVCKFFDGAFEASSVVTRDGDYVRQYLAAPMTKFFTPTLSCSGPATGMEARKTCTTDDDDGVTVATLEVDRANGLDASQDAACYDACVLHAKVEGVSGGGCCRMNHFNGNCNWYAGEATSDSTTHMMHALEMTCS